MASNTGSANPSEAAPGGGAPAPHTDGRVWGITTKSTPGTKGPSGNVTGNGNGGNFKC